MHMLHTTGRCTHWVFSMTVMEAAGAQGPAAPIEGAYDGFCYTWCCLGCCVKAAQQMSLLCKAEG